jgi:hypothetical protein
MHLEGTRLRARRPPSSHRRGSRPGIARPSATHLEADLSGADFEGADLDEAVLKNVSGSYSKLVPDLGAGPVAAAVIYDNDFQIWIILMPDRGKRSSDAANCIVSRDNHRDRRMGHSARSCCVSIMFSIAVVSVRSRASMQSPRKKLLG